MKKLMLLIAASFVLVGCGGIEEEEEKTIEELKESINDSKEELKEIYSDMNESHSSDEVEEETINSDSINNIEIEDDSDASSDSINEIEKDVENIVNKDLDDTSITDIRINEDASIDEERYIVLVDLEWDVQNKPKTTKEMLDMYSDHLAANLSDSELIYELVLFWTVPYHNEDDSILKRTYENKDEGMFLGDEVKDINVFD